MRIYMNEITLSDLTEFTVSELWPLTCQITESTSLNYDFKISGLDGLEFMETFADKFHVDLRGFDWVEFFGKEGVSVPFSCIFDVIKRFVFKSSAKSVVHFPELTLGHLVVCANHGKWVSPE